MITFIQIVVIVYVLYYTGNILYDIFLKKETQVIDQENAEEFSFGESVRNVAMEQVEEMTTSSHFEVDEDEIFSNDSSDPTTDVDVEVLKRKYQEEIELENDDKNDTSHQETQIKEEPTAPTSDTENVGGFSNEKDTVDKSELIKKNKQRFKEFLNLAETSVQTIITADGEKLFKSTMF